MLMPFVSPSQSFVHKCSHSLLLVIGFPTPLVSNEKIKDALDRVLGGETDPGHLKGEDAGPTADVMLYDAVKSDGAEDADKVSDSSSNSSSSSSLSTPKPKPPKKGKTKKLTDTHAEAAAEEANHTGKKAKPKPEPKAPKAKPAVKAEAESKKTPAKTGAQRPLARNHSFHAAVNENTQRNISFATAGGTTVSTKT